MNDAFGAILETGPRRFVSQIEVSSQKRERRDFWVACFEMAAKRRANKTARADNRYLDGRL